MDTAREHPIQQLLLIALGAIGAVGLGLGASIVRTGLLPEQTPVHC